MFALISPNELVTNTEGITGMRVAEINTNAFEVADPLFWVDCPDDCIPRLTIYLDGNLVFSLAPTQLNPSQ